jgi:hypothetical protein
MSHWNPISRVSISIPRLAASPAEYVLQGLAGCYAVTLASLAALSVPSRASGSSELIV